MSETATMERTCQGCGKPLQLRAIPENLKGTKLGDDLERFQFLCDTCDAARTLDWEHEEAIQEDRTRATRLRERIADSRIPTALRRVDWEAVRTDDANREAARAAYRWGRGDIRGLVLGGPVGVGKTWLAAAAANAMVRRRTVRWFAASKLMAQARAGFKNPARDEVTELLVNEHLALVLDDIDKIKPTEYALDIFFQVIDGRIANGTPILVTTNKRYPELKVQFGEPIASRLLTCEAHRIEGEDRRKGTNRSEDA